MSPDEIETYFTRSDGQFAFARWARPMAPVVFGVTDETLAIVKGAIEAVGLLAGVPVAETDPELGVNLLVFFFEEWGELIDTPDLDRLIPDLVPLVAKLEARGANQYRVFRFDPKGGIRAAFVFNRMDKELSLVPAETLALGQMAQTILLWSDTAFKYQSPLAQIGQDGATILRPEIATLIRAAYDPVLPEASVDPSHALRLAARVQILRREAN